MDTTEKVIMLILAVALALFLILAIVSIVLIIRVVKSVNRVTLKAEQLINSAETVSQVFKQTAEQMTLVRFVRNVAEMVGKHQGAKSSKKGE